MKQQTSGLAKRLTDKTIKLKEETAAHKKTKNDLKEAQDFIATLTQENLELGKLVKDLQARFEKGGVVYTMNDGYVSSAKHLPQYSEYTYDQPIHEAIGTALYNRYPFVIVEDRQLRIDEAQYKKYKLIKGA
jgi:hypothetical protein